MKGKLNMNERWMPEYGDTFWYVSEFAEVCGTTWVDDEIDPVFYESGNCFRTAEEAEAAAEKVKALLLSLHDKDMVTNTCKALDKGKENVAKATCTFGNLPKLTAEVFDRPDCPAWAKYAAVRENGIAIWFEVKPNIGRDYPANKFWHSTWNSENIPGEWDASDWQNSLVERPAKLPEWCWNGALGWENGDYFRLEVIDADHQVTMKYLDDGVEESVIAGYIAEHVKQARLRPYNADEIPKLPFEVSEINSDFRTIVVSCKGDKIWLGGASTAISTEELMRDFTIDGKPCGVLEHLENGKWVQ